MYTFWAARRGHDFNFLGPFLFGAVMVLMVFAFIQVCLFSCFLCFFIWILLFPPSSVWIFMVFLNASNCSWLQILFPLGRISVMIYGCLASIIFCGYIIYDTDNLIKRYSYDEYIWASVSLYLDILNLFLALLTIFRAADSWNHCPVSVYKTIFQFLFLLGIQLNQTVNFKCTILFSSPFLPSYLHCWKSRCEWQEICYHLHIYSWRLIAGFCSDLHHRCLPSPFSLFFCVFIIFFPFHVCLLPRREKWSSTLRTNDRCVFVVDSCPVWIISMNLSGFNR